MYTALGYDFHIKTMTKMLRVCKEIRVFPIVDLDANKTELIGNVINYFRKCFRVDIINTDYEFQKGDKKCLLSERGGNITGIYFSGTGNTRYCIERFLEKLGTDKHAFPIEDAAAVQAISADSEIVFSYPVYYSNIPKIVKDFIADNKSQWQGKRIFIIATMGIFSGDGAGVSARLFKKYGAEISGGLHLKMPDCIGDVELLKKPPDENRRVISQAAQKIDMAAERYRNGRPPHEGLSVFHHIAGLFGQRLWFGRKVKNYAKLPKINVEKCVGCGACEKLCPMGNITIKNGKALSGSKCTMCYRCFSECPCRAITIIGKRVIVQYKFDNRYV